MASVRIENKALQDARFYRLGRGIGAPRKWAYSAGLTCMIQIWSYCTERGMTEVVAGDIEAFFAMVPIERAVRALLDSELLENTDKPGRYRLAGGSRLLWLRDQRERTESGSELTLDERILAAATTPQSASAIARIIHCNKSVVLAATRRLTRKGLLRKIDDGRLVAAGEPGLEIEGTASTTVPEPVPEPVPSLPSPVPDLAPVNQGTMCPEPTRSEPVPDGFPEPPAELATSSLVPFESRRAIAHVLWRYQELLRRHIDPTTPSLPADDTPGGPFDEICRRLARYTPAQCRHALIVFCAEAECLRAAGRDALEFLNGRTNWRSEPFERAAGSTVEAVRKRYRKPPLRAVDSLRPTKQLA